MNERDLHLRLAGETFYQHRDIIEEALAVWIAQHAYDPGVLMPTFRAAQAAYDDLVELPVVQPTLTLRQIEQGIA